MASCPPSARLQVLTASGASDVRNDDLPSGFTVQNNPNMYARAPATDFHWYGSDSTFVRSDTDADVVPAANDRPFEQRSTINLPSNASVGTFSAARARERRALLRDQRFALSGCTKPARATRRSAGRALTLAGGARRSTRAPSRGGCRNVTGAGNLVFHQHTDARFRWHLALQTDADPPARAPRHARRPLAERNNRGRDLD